MIAYKVPFYLLQRFRLTTMLKILNVDPEEFMINKL